MSKKESRIERKKERKSLQEKSKTSLNKVYYWIIAFLFFILLLLVLFIFSKSEAKVDLTENDANSELVEEKPEVSDADTNQSSENETEDNQSDETEIEEESEDETEEEDEQTIVNEDAPYDSDHAIDFNGGSADRIAIKEKIIEATGLGNDLIEYWVGNNGPGRVSATVASPDQSEIYEVKLQYGDGEWHVTNYNSLDSLPDNFN